jgi:hypothetical protein
MCQEEEAATVSNVPDYALSACLLISNLEKLNKNFLESLFYILRITKCKRASSL